MGKKISILLVGSIVLFILGGWGKKAVQLLDSKPLIDLSKAIEFAMPGGSPGESTEPEDQTDISETSEDIEEMVEPEEPEEAVDLSEHEELEEVTKDMLIRIHGESVFYTFGKTTLEDVTEKDLEKQIREDYSSIVQVKLMDDFAESHTYKSIRKMLELLKEELGMDFIEDRYPEESE